MTTPSTTASLEGIFSLEDVLYRHLMPFLTAADVCRLESCNKRLAQTDEDGWKILCERDFSQRADSDGDGSPPKMQCIAPVMTDGPSFDLLQDLDSWKTAYQHWNKWQVWTHGTIPSWEMIRSIRIWKRLKKFLIDNHLSGTVESLLHGVSSEDFAEMDLPSSVLALAAVHAGQQDFQGNRINPTFFYGLFGSWSVYNTLYSMRMTELNSRILSNNNRAIHIASSIAHPPVRLFLERPVGQKDWKQYRIAHSTPSSDLRYVAKEGTTMLDYMEAYVDRLEAGVFKPASIIPGMEMETRGISLFPDANLPNDPCPMMSCAVTRGVEVKASARWTPGFHGDDESNGCNFAYSIRIQLVEAADALTRCQLVGRHWEFVDGLGSVRRVDGEAVVGKQPLLFRNEDGTCGYIDLGPAGSGRQCPGEIFVYQSQSGPVRGTSPSDTGQACVRGTFSFMPGSIENPTGPMFHVTVAEFPLAIPMPFF